MLHALSPLIATADLPPVAADALAELVTALGSPPVPSDGDAVGSDVVVARNALGEELGRVLKSLGDLSRHPCQATLLALAVATLAEAHRLDPEPGRPPCRAACDVAADLHRLHGLRLRRRVRLILQGVVDGVATEGGRRSFVTEARALLARARKWRPTCLDVDASMALRLGGVAVTYKTSRELENGQRVLGTATLSPSNLEGRLLLLTADGRAPENAHPSVVSRVSGAVTRVTHGAAKLTRDARGRPCFVPALELSRRARRLAQTIKSLQGRPRLRPDAPASRKKSTRVSRSAGNAR